MASGGQGGDAEPNAMDVEEGEAGRRAASVPVICGDLRGVFHADRTIVSFDGKDLSPSEFEGLGRPRYKKWKWSIRVLRPDGAPGETLGQWLEPREAPAELTRDALCASSFIPQEWRHPRGLPIDLNMDWWGKLAKDWATDSLSSHAHGDHTQGLKKDVPGTIYAVQETANLLQCLHQVPDGTFRIVQYNVPFYVKGSWVVPLNAYHSRGSTSYLVFSPGYPPKFLSGDFRACLEMIMNPWLNLVRGRCTAVLDSTFAKSCFEFFPTRAQAKAYMIQEVQLALSRNKDLLILFGDYKTFGKEDLFMALARLLDCLVYVSEEKLATLRAMPLAPEDLARLTTDPTATNLHVVSLPDTHGERGWAALADALRLNPRCTAAMSVYASGFVADGHGPGYRGELVTYNPRISRLQVAHSAHCSFQELRAFVRWLKPIGWVPFVGNNGSEDARRRFEQLQAP